MQKKKKTAVVIAVAALVLAVVLLAVSGGGGFKAIAGGETITNGAELTDGAYVKADLTYILDVIGVERDAAGVAAAYYAVAPLGNQFTVVRFPASDYDNMTALEAATTAFLRGESQTMDIHLLVAGTGRTLDEETGQLLAGWFNDNAAWMRRAGVITEVDNYGDYLNTVMLRSGDAGAFGYAAAVAMTAAAVLLLLAAAVLFVLLARGVFDENRKGKRHG